MHEMIERLSFVSNRAVPILLTLMYYRMSSVRSHCLHCGPTGIHLPNLEASHVQPYYSLPIALCAESLATNARVKCAASLCAVSPNASVGAPRFSSIQKAASFEAFG